MGVYTGTVPTFLAGELPDADKFTEVSNFMTAATSAWTSFSCTWRSGGTQPALGNGTLVSVYRRLGKTIDVQILLTIGSTSTFGTSFYYFDLPVASTRESMGMYSATDISAGSFSVGVSVISALTGLAGLGFITPLTTTGAATTATVPFTWATSDRLRIAATYEVA